MHPHAFQPETVQAALLARRVRTKCEREFSARSVCEQRGREYRRAGIDERRDLLFGPLEQAAIGGKEKSPRPE